MDVCNYHTLLAFVLAILILIFQKNHIYYISVTVLLSESDYIEFRSVILVLLIVINIFIIISYCNKLKK
jgi:hypothetical protein